MEKIRCIIADDEPLALQLLKSYVEKIPFLELLQACNSAVEVMSYISDDNQVDLLFLDIQMPNLTGMQLAKALGNTGPKIIFTTAFEQYAIEGYKVDAIDYLLKPFSFDEFLMATQKAKRKLSEVSSKNSLNSTEDKVMPGYVIVKSDYKLRQISLEDIVYIEGVKDYVKIHRRSENKAIMSLMSMKMLEAKLPSEQFMRVHRSFIVNLNHIEIIERGMIVFEKNYIPVSDKYKDLFQSFLSKRFLE